jgi:hypothetical protein
MRPLKLALCAGVMSLASYGVSASTLGLVEFKSFTNNSFPFVAEPFPFNADLGAADTLVNQFNGAPNLPNGLPIDYVVHLKRTFIGDGNSATADSLQDNYLFKLDPSTIASTNGQRVVADLSLVSGLDNGNQNVAFSLFKADSNGVVGDLITSIQGEGNFQALLDGSTHYLLRVIGNLRADIASTLGIDESSNFGQYNIVFGAFGVVVPIPPAILLFLTGIAALFGFTGLRRKGETEGSVATA